MLLETIYKLGSEEMTSIYKGWISDETKIKQLAESDGKSTADVAKDIVTGMVGEWGSYHYMKENGIDCNKPDCSVLKRDSAIWNKDLLALNKFKIITNSKDTNIAETVITCKAQLLSKTKEISEQEPSWTFQKKTSDRYGDPILENPKCNKLLLGAWVNDSFDGANVNHWRPRVAYENGFRWKVKVFGFWWPQVFEYLRGPKNPNLSNKKKCLYLSDIKHLKVNVVPID